MCLQKNDADSFLDSNILIMELAMSKIAALYFNCLNRQPENIKIYDLSKVQIEGAFWPSADSSDLNELFEHFQSHDPTIEMETIQQLSSKLGYELFYRLSS